MTKIENYEILNNFRNENGKISLFYKIFLFVFGVFILSFIFKNSLYQGSFVLLNLLFLSHLIYHKNYKILVEILKDKKILTISFIGIFISMIVSNLLNSEFLSKNSWETTILFLFRYGFIFLALCYFYNLKFFSQNLLRNLFIISCLIAIFGAILQIIQNPQILFDLKEGGLKNRNGFGLIIGFAFVFSLVFIQNLKIKLPVLFIFMIFLILSFSRASWVAAFCATFLFCVLNFKNFKKIYLFYILIFICTILIIYANSKAVQIRLEMLMEGNSAYRYEIWKYSISRILEHPIFGWGVDTFRNLPNSVVKIDPQFNATHNAILEVLLYTGIFGFIFAAGSILAVFWQIIKVQNFAVLALFIYLFVIIQFDHGFYMSKISVNLIVVTTFLAFLKDKK